MTTEENDQVLQRKEKLELLRGDGNAYPNDFRRDTDTREIRRNFAHIDEQTLSATPTRVTIAGRVMTRRVMGKAGFADMHDEHGKIQIYAQRDRLADGVYNRLFIVHNIEYLSFDCILVNWVYTGYGFLLSYAESSIFCLRHI